MTKIQFHIKKSRFKEPKCADRGHSLNRDFTVQWTLLKPAVLDQTKVPVLSGWLYSEILK